MTRPLRNSFPPYVAFLLIFLPVALIYFGELGEAQPSGARNNKQTSRFGHSPDSSQCGIRTLNAGNIYLTNSTPTSATSADFNNDGIPDIVVSNNADGNIYLFLGNGDGTFEQAKLTPFDIGFGMVAADLDGDGNIDLAVSGTADHLTASVGILRGNGDGTFKTPVFYPAGGSGGKDIYLADLNNDGKPDLIIANRFSDDISVLLGHGDATFSSGIATPLMGPTPASTIAIGDVNGDGNLDVVAGSDTTSIFNTQVFFGDGHGGLTFQNSFHIVSGPMAFSLADLNGDGKLDLVAGGQHGVEIYSGNGVGAFTFATSLGAPGGFSVAVKDLNGDGKLDVIAGYPDTAGGSMAVFLGNGLGNFMTGRTYATGTTPYFPIVDDFNGDGKLDLGTIYLNDQTLSIMLGDGQGRFNGPQAIYIGVSTSALLLADIDHDGMKDLVATNKHGGRISASYNDGTGGFPAGIDSNGFDVDSGGVAGDFTGDGKEDIISVVTDANAVALHRVNVMNRLEFGGLTNVGLKPVAVAAGDLNQDGSLDIVTANSGSNDISVLMGNNLGGFTLSQTLNVGQSPSSVIIGDFDGDGKLDVAVSNEKSNDITVFIGTGGGQLGSARTVSIGGSPHKIVSGDFNHDGKLDLATANFSSKSVSILLGDGLGGFSSSTLAVDEYPNAIAAGDFNGDGATDLAIGTYLDIQEPTLGGLTILYSDGSGGIASRTHYLNRYFGLLISGDTDGDGLQDIVTGGSRMAYIISGACLSASNLALTQSDGGGSGIVGLPLAYSIQVSNSGPNFSERVKIQDRIPSNTLLNNVSTSQGSCAQSKTILCDLGTLNVGATATINISVTPVKAGVATNTARVTSSTPNLLSANNSVLKSTTINNPLPNVATLVPSNVLVGNKGVKVAVNGTGFTDESEMRWNGSARQTLFINSTQLIGSLDDNDVVSAGQAQVTVFTPIPGGGLSNSLPFDVQKGTATISLSNLSQTYDGTQKSVDISVIPTGLAGISVLYDGSTNPPTNAGNYAVSASLSNPNYQASSVSDTFIISRANQTLSFAAIPDKLLYDGPIQLNGSASSGLPIIYEATGGVSISGNMVTILGTGSATITASQPGNNNYNAAQSVSHTFNINNPLPQVRRLDPGAIIAGSGQTTLKVSGSNFVTDSLVKIDGVNSAATFVNRIEMDIPLSAADLASPGTKTITISNPSPGGGTAIPVTLKIISITSSDSKNIQAGTTDTVSNAPTQAGDSGITAQLNHSQSAAGPATVTVEQYSADPLGGSGLIDAGGGYVDLKVAGTDPNDTLNATFYYGSNVTGANEDKLQLLYFTGTKWAKVRSSGNVDPIKSTTDNQDGTVSGGSFTVVFDETSSPKLSQLTGTIFSSTPGLYGDLNNDQVINVIDLILMANFLAGNTTVDKTAGDLTLDGKLNVSDLITLANFLAGNIGHLPVGNAPTASNPSDPISLGYGFVGPRMIVESWFPIPLGRPKRRDFSIAGTT